MTSGFNLRYPSDSIARMRTRYSLSDLASSASASAASLSPRMPSARAAMARTNGSSSLSADRRAFRSAALMMSYSSATRSCQPLAKFSSLGGYWSRRYCSRGEFGWDQPAPGRSKRPARVRVMQYIAYFPFATDSQDKPELRMARDKCKAHMAGRDTNQPTSSEGSHGKQITRAGSDAARGYA